MCADAAILIRQYRANDVDALHDAVLESRTELSRWMPWCHAGYSREDSVNWVHTRSAAWERLEEWSFVITDAADRLLGGCGLHRISQRAGVAELGYWVRTSATGQGLATRAAQQLCDWACQSQGLHRIEIVVDLDNHASRRVAEKAGGIYEATLRKRVRHGHVWRDAALYAILSNASAEGAGE